MASYGVAEAKNKFTHLLERVEAGESITITRHGKPVAEMTATSRARQPKSLTERREALKALTTWRDAQSPLPMSAADLVRKMRDEEI